MTLENLLSFRQFLALEALYRILALNSSSLVGFLISSFKISLVDPSAVLNSFPPRNEYNYLNYRGFVLLRIRLFIPLNKIRIAEMVENETTDRSR